MERLAKLNRIIRRVMLIAAAISVTAMICLIVTNVLMRALWHSIFGTVEMVGWLGACITAFGLAYSQQCREHIAVTVLTDWLPRRATWLLDISGYVVGLLLALVSGFGLYAYIIQMAATGQRSTSLEIIYWPIAACVFVGIVGFAFQLLVDLCEAISRGPAAAGPPKAE